MTMSRGDLQAMLAAAAGELGVAGAQLSLFDGHEQTDVATGFADRRRDVRADVDTLFQIGSTTKLFNATLVHQLVDEGRLDLDAPLTDVLAGVRIGGFRAANMLTARDLLSMRSGIDNGPYTDFGAGDDAVARYVEALAEIPLVAPPGQLFGYSNASSVVAGRMVERITGRTWEQALRERVLERSELQESAATPDELPYHGVAVGHAPGGDPVRPWSHPRSLAPAGSTLCTSAGDLVRFARSIMDGSLLSAESREALQTPQIACPPILLADHWGAGAFLRTWDGQRVVGHSGTNLSGSSTLLWLPDVGATVATTVNVPRLGYPLTARVLGEILPDMLGVSPPPPPTPDATIDVDHEAVCGRFRAYGVEHRIEHDHDGLALTTRSLLGLMEPIRVRLLPIGPTTFLPDDLAASGNRGYAMHVVLGDDGRATHLLHGVFLSARAD